MPLLWFRIGYVKFEGIGWTIKNPDWWKFEVDAFSRLDKEDKEFIELFLQKRGSIKDVGEEIGISYPTVRNRIDKIVSKLGGKIDKKSHRLDILNMLDNGEITTEKAKELLEEINNDWRKTTNPKYA